MPNRLDRSAGPILTLSAESVLTKSPGQLTSIAELAGVDLLRPGFEGQICGDDDGISRASLIGNMVGPCGLEPQTSTVSI